MSRITKLAWTRQPNVYKNAVYKNAIVLMAEAVYEHGAVTMTGLGDEHMDPVQRWCEQTACGTRMAFNIFHFKNEHEATAFLLKWG